MFREDDEYRRQFEEENNVTVLDESFQMTETAYEQFHSLMIAGTEQIYVKIFVGNYSPTTFQMDIGALNWFRYLYK